MTKQFKRSVTAVLAAAMMLSASGCNTGSTGTGETGTEAGGTTKKAEGTAAETVAETVAPEETEGYAYGLNETFHSDEPVTYTMYFSDASWYPMVDTWKTEGVFEKIKEKTNVTLDITSYDSGDYTNKIALDINGGSTAYIIPKVYDDSQFVDSGAVVPVSDYAKYMPNYSDFINKYNLQKDINTIVKNDGKYYRLPGLHEAPYQDYTLIIRDDIFKAAGYNVAELENDWTWDEFYDVLVGVKAYMVDEGMCKESDYIWSDLWCGGESGQGNGGYLCKLMGASYGVPSGWAVDNALQYDEAKDEWYFASSTDDYKAFVTCLNKFVEGGILDPETFTQDDAAGNNKFYNGQSVVQGVNKSQYTTWLSGLDTGIGAGNYETYITVYPKGSNNYIAENARLECGVMISSKALKELGEDEFIKMMRFVDWLWYSEEAYTLTKWGVEGETWQYAKDEASGTEIKQLLPGYICGGLGISGAETDTDIRLQWGYACGNFFYGHASALRDDNLTPVFQDYSKRVGEYRDVRPLNPSVVMDSETQELFNIRKTSIVDTVNTYTLNFITGQKDVEADWDKYLADLQAANVDDYVKMYNDAYRG